MLFRRNVNPIIAVSKSSLERILAPRSVAVIGASTDPSKRGHQAFRSLLEAPFAGKVYATHPNQREILGQEVFPSVGELPEVPDLVYVATPAATVPSILEQCASSKVGGAVIPAVGFRESGAAGAALEESIARLANQLGIRVVGPNTSGLLVTALQLNLVGMRNVPMGDLALLSQSGNVALDIINGAARWSVGLSIYVGVGNETDVRFDEYLDYLSGHTGTNAIMIYVEGFRDGRAFLDVVGRTTSSKPVILLKGGRSDRGVAAARSHTGALAGSYPVLRAALRQRGVTEVRRSDELLAVGATLAHQRPVTAGLDVVVLSDGGGHGTLAADSLADTGVHLAEMQSGTTTKLRSLLGAAASINNPVDVAGAADRDPIVLAKAIEIIAADPGCGGIILVGLFGGYAIRFADSLAESELDAAHHISLVMSTACKPLIVHSLYTNSMPPALKHLIDQGFTVVESLEIGCRCLAALHARGLLLASEPLPVSQHQRRHTASSAIQSARHERRSTLTEIETRQLLAEHNVPLVPAHACESADATAAAVDAIDGPVVVKIVSPSISHKTDAGGVILNVKDRDAGRAAFATALTSAANYAVERGFVPNLRGVLVMPMLPSPIAELIVGVQQDPDFGPVLTVGAGGIEVEVHHDTAMRGLPIGRGDVLEMLDEIRISRLLKGFRGRPPADREVLADVILNIAACALAHQEVVELEANPVFAYEDRAIVVDARAFLTDFAVATSSSEQ